MHTWGGVGGVMLPDISFEDCFDVLLCVPQKDVMLQRSRLSPLKDTCHIINTSQSFLDNGKDSVHLSCVLFCLCSCSSLLCSVQEYRGIFTCLLIASNNLLSLFFISRSSHQQRGFTLGVIYAFPE